MAWLSILNGPIGVSSVTGDKHFSSQILYRCWIPEENQKQSLREEKGTYYRWILLKPRRLSLVKFLLQGRRVLSTNKNPASIGEDDGRIMPEIKYSLIYYSIAAFLGWYIIQVTARK